MCSLLKKSLNIFFRNIKDLPEFMSLPFEQFMELIKSDDLCAEEIEVCIQKIIIIFSVYYVQCTCYYCIIVLYYYYYSMVISLPFRL